jgi:transposase InsO family protein
VIDAEEANYPVAMMCALLGVSRSGYYAWKKRARPCARRRTDLELGDAIEAIFERSGRRYGSPRIHQQLRRDGVFVSRKRVERLMRERRLWARRVRRCRVTTNSNHSFPVAPNRLGRDFGAEGPDMIWAGDITYIDTAKGFVYLAVLLDLHTRRVVGWSMAEHMETSLVEQALRHALGSRSPEPGMIHHSDRGTQYASGRYQRSLEHAGITVSMSRRGNCLDNAVVESFFGTLKQELVHREEWLDLDEARRAIHAYIEVFYNTQRLHSSLGYRTPAEADAAAA